VSKTSESRLQKDQVAELFVKYNKTMGHAHVFGDNVSTEQSVNQRGRRSGGLTMTLPMVARSFGHEQNTADHENRDDQGGGEAA
jgi:hypothetical protein